MKRGSSPTVRLLLLKTMPKIEFIVWLMLINKAYMLFQKSYAASFVSWKSTGSIIDLRFRLLGRDRRVNGTMFFLEDLGNEHITVGIDTYNDPYGSGDYKQLPFSMVEKPVCKSLKENWKYFDPSVTFGVNTDCPLHNGTCPLPKGTYYVKDVVIKPNNWPLILPRGYFIAVVTFKKDKKVISTQEIGIKIVDRTT